MTATFADAAWAFPPHVDATGSIALIRRDREIAQSIRLILATAPGERPMRPEFGCRIHDLVFAPADTATAGRIAYEVRRSLEQWEPRIDLDDVVVGFDPLEYGTLHIDVRYTLRGVDEARTLVVPFHLSSPEPGA